MALAGTPGAKSLAGTRRPFADRISAVVPAGFHRLSHKSEGRRFVRRTGPTSREPGYPQNTPEPASGVASALVQAGRDPQSIRSLADLLAPEAAKAALRIVWTRLGKRETGYLHNLALLLVYLGRHWVKLPPHEVDRLRELRSSLDPGPVGMTERNQKLLLQFAEPANRAALLRLPGRLMDEAQRRDRGRELKHVSHREPSP